MFNRAEKPGNGVDDDGNGYIDDHGGYNVAAGRGDANDENGHDTHVTGIIAAASNKKTHSVGMCRNAKVVRVRFLGADARGNTSGSAEGIVYAVRADATVINCSYTSSTPTRVENDAIAFARARGVLVVAAAGNQSADNDRVPVFPAVHPFDNVIAVASTSYLSIGQASFSNWGRRTVELAAAGSDIQSTWLHGSYRALSGTSMAAPAVTAAAAAIKSRRGWRYQKIRARILNTVTHDSSLRRTATSGRLNFERAVGSQPTPRPQAVALGTDSITASLACIEPHRRGSPWTAMPTRPARRHGPLDASQAPERFISIGRTVYAGRQAQHPRPVG